MSLSAARTLLRDEPALAAHPGMHEDAQSTQTTSPSLAHTSRPVVDGPVPMTMPAILTNPHLRHLHQSSRAPPLRARDAGSNAVGKRRQRRSENNRFASNPHVAKPSLVDYELCANNVRSTFGDAHELTGVPSAVDQTAPSHGPPHFERESALKGQFSMGLNEAQQFLRTRLKCTPTHSLRAALDALMNTDTQPYTAMAPIERLICIAGREMVEWLETTVHVKNNTAPSGPRIIVAHQDSPDADEKAVLVEARRSPSLLIWKIDDAYSRLAVHCIARVLQCPSFSRTCMAGSPQTGWSTERHTYILHPNPLRRVSLRRTSYARPPRHRRTSSASTTSSTASTQPARTPGPLASDLAHHSATLIYTPPVTETEATESPDDHDRAFSTDYTTDSDGTDASLDDGIA